MLLREICNKVKKDKQNECKIDLEILNELKKWLGIEGELVNFNSELSAYYLNEIPNAILSRTPYYSSVLFLNGILVGLFKYNSDSNYLSFHFLDEISKKSVKCYMETLIDIEEEAYSDCDIFLEDFEIGSRVNYSNQLPSTVIYKNCMCAVENVIDEYTITVNFKGHSEVVKANEVLIPFIIDYTNII